MGGPGEARVDAPHYSIVIEWSERDKAYVALLPEWADRYIMPDGDTYKEALASASRALATLHPACAGR